MPAPTLVGSAQTTIAATGNFTITPHASTQVGDLMVVVAVVRTTSSTAPATPAQWASLGAQRISTTAWLVAYAKYRRTSETTYTVASGSNGPGSALSVHTFRNAVIPSVTGVVTTGAAATSHTSPAITTLANDSTLIRAVASIATTNAAATWTWPAGSSELVDFGVGSTSWYAAQSVAVESAATAGAQAADTVTHTATRTWAGFTFALEGTSKPVASSGPKPTGANAEQVTAAPYSRSWTSIGNSVGMEDGTLATNSATTAAFTRKTVWNNFGFAAGDFPAGAVITGVRAEMLRGSSNDQAADETMRLTLDGTNEVGDNRLGANWLLAASPATRWDNMGGETDLWGTGGLTIAQVTTTTFGIRTAFKALSDTGGGASIRVDTVRMFIYYEVPSTGQSGFLMSFAA